MADPQPPQLTPFQQGLQKAYMVAKQLPPDQREHLLRAYFQQKVNGSPEFMQMYPTMQERAGIYKDFTGEDMLHAPPERPGMPQRILGAENYHNPLTLNPWAHLGNAANLFGTPGRIAKEGVDAGLDAAGVRQPNKGGTATGPGAILPDTLGGWAQLPVDWYAGKPMMAAMRFPFQTLAALRRWGQGIEEAKRAAQVENMAWEAGVRPGGPKALPGAGGTGGSWPMPSGRPAPTGYPPWVRPSPTPPTPPSPGAPVQYGRPPELMPKPRAGGQPRVIDGEAWTVE